MSQTGNRASDQLLVERVKAGDKHAFDLLVLKYQHRIIKLIMRYVKDPSEAMDVSQEAFIKAYRAIPNFRGDSAFYTWMYRIAINTAKNHLVAAGRRPLNHAAEISEPEEYEWHAGLQEPDGAGGPLVFLNACQVGRQGYNLAGTGGFAKAFVKSGAGAFISTHWSVGDRSALDFSKTLYKQLLEGENMMTAVAAARKAAKNMEEMTWLAYVVYADPYAKLMRE